MKILVDDNDLFTLRAAASEFLSENPDNPNSKEIKRALLSTNPKPRDMRVVAAEED